uniref:Uncharacterized protein n=1 Tax=Anguilla anguilla TaxID=7936 RepID=A0A0E9P5G6_ANGAN
MRGKGSTNLKIGNCTKNNNNKKTYFIKGRQPKCYTVYI